jgi:hypothetical protein
VKIWITFVSKCTNKLKKDQTIEKREDNMKQNLRKKEKTQSKTYYYTCQKRGHMVNSCSLGNNYKPILYDTNIVLIKMATMHYWLKLQTIQPSILRQCLSLLL